MNINKEMISSFRDKMIRFLVKLAIAFLVTFLVLVSMFLAYFYWDAYMYEYHKVMIPAVAAAKRLIAENWANKSAVEIWMKNIESIVYVPALLAIGLTALVFMGISRIEEKWQQGKEKSDL